MSLLSIIADLSGLTGELARTNVQLLRIADALVRLSPVLPAAETALPSSSSSRDGSPPRSSQPLQFSVSESPGDYKVRTARETALALDLGFLPEHPDFQAILAEMREDLLQVRVPVQTGRHERAGEPAGLAGDAGDAGDAEAETRPLAKVEIDAILRDSFSTAQADAQERAKARLRSLRSYPPGAD